MSQINKRNDMVYNDNSTLQILISSACKEKSIIESINLNKIHTISCPSCGHNIQLQAQGLVHDLPGLPVGVKFDPSDQEILEHLKAKVQGDTNNLHPLINEFIPTIGGENGICYTHPEKLPGVRNDGQIRHFFHRPSKAYTTGTRKRRKVHTDAESVETRWHKTGKTRTISMSATMKGYKKFLVLYTNYGQQKKFEKTNWVMHQYHIGDNEDENDGEFVLSKIFYQTQPRNCASGVKESSSLDEKTESGLMTTNASLADYYSARFPFISYKNVGQSQMNREIPHQLMPNFVVECDESSYSLTDGSSKRKR